MTKMGGTAEGTFVLNMDGRFLFYLLLLRYRKEATSLQDELRTIEEQARKEITGATSSQQLAEFRLKYLARRACDSIPGLGNSSRKKGHW